MEKEIESIWKGSLYNASMVAKEIYNRYGADAVKRYDPELNCFTYNGWKQRGYQVRRGEKGMEILNFIPVSREKVNDDGTKSQESGRICRASYVFFETQVDPLKAGKAA